jgi:hypothetical protein
MTPDTPPPPAPNAPAPRAAALVSLAFAAAVGIGSWFLFGRAADSGVERLARLDRMRELCAGYYATARDRMDSMRVDRVAIPDTIDPGSKDAYDRCGDFRGPSVPNELPNPREMSGQEMPRGLR